MTGTVLLTLGRLPTALELARGFAGRGWRVLVAEPFGMHLARMSRSVARSYRVTAPVLDPPRYLAELRELVERERVRLIVPVSEESMHVAALGAGLPAGVELFCPSQRQILALHDKLEFNRAAAALGLAVPRSAPAGTPEAARLAAGGDVVVKPRFTCSGRGLSVHARGSLPAPDPGTLVQERLVGDEISSLSVVREGRVLGTAVYRGVVMSGSVAVCFERVAAARAVERWVRRFADGTGHTGFIGFDFILGADGEPAAIECNPRATSGLHFFEPATLAGGILAGDAVALRAAPLLTESWSCFTAALGSLFEPSARRRNFRLLRQARDVSWSGRDPWPFLLMMVNTMPLIGRAVWRRRTFAEVAALDIEWREAHGPS